MQPSMSRLACIALLLTLPVTASAQQPTASFDQLGSLIQAGDVARIIDASGHEVRGRVRHLSSSSLVLQVAGAPRTFLEADIERIQRRRNDPLANGARWGGAVGAGLGMLAGAEARQRHDRTAMGPYYVAYVGLLAGMVGASAGAVFDALHADERVVYSRHGLSSSVKLYPILARDRQGFLATVTLGR